MRTVINKRAAVTVNAAKIIRTGFASDHPKSIRE